MIIPFKNRTIDDQKTVRVYRNLSKRGYRYSIQQSGKVVAHATDLVLTDVKFKINEAGRQRVVKTKRKNVHAFAVGYYPGETMGQYYTKALRKSARQISYNPYTQPWFGTPLTKVYGATFCFLDSDGMYVPPWSYSWGGFSASNLSK